MFISRSAFRGGMLAVALSVAGVAANAAGSVAWLSPSDGSSFPVGTSVSPMGQANAKGTVGGGLDLVLVLDSSGSMGSSVRLPTGVVTRQQLQQDAANALVNGLPSGTNVGVVDFDSSASVVQTLTPTPDPAINTAIDGINAFGGTDIARGITVADGELERGVDVAFLLVAADVHAFLTGAVVSVRGVLVD